MKLLFDVNGKNQPDPFIFENENKLYLYVTGRNGVEAYMADDLFGVWNYYGIVAQFKDVVYQSENQGDSSYWAPSVIKYNGKFYMYVSCEKEGKFHFMHAAEADSPCGPFINEKCIYDYFSIDSHVIETKTGLFLLYAKNSSEKRAGTRVVIDRLIDPYTPENKPKEVIVPTFDEEIFPACCSKNTVWHTVEGPFWFKEGDWQYIMYSGGCFQNDTYHIGYAAAKSDETDLKKIDFKKHTENGKFSPVIIKNNNEEGTGHNSVIKYRGEYYAVYHGRDYSSKKTSAYIESRTARVCRLLVNDGKIIAER